MAYQTKQQQAVLRCLEARATQSVTAGDLAEDLRLAGRPVGLATIYRQLDKLEAAGLVHKLITAEGALYQFCTHHPEQDCLLLRCRRCGRVCHLDCAQLQGLFDHLAQDHAFRVDARGTVLTGLCADCFPAEEGTCHENH